VYGTSLPLSRRKEGKAQHLGLGRKLVERACERAAAAGYADLAVISAVGTRAYYRGLGFRDGPLYQHRRLAVPRPRRSANQTLRNSSA
jgi:elongator complex protein 3